MCKRRRPALPEEAGFALIEVVVSGMVAVIVAGAVFTLLQASTRSAADERARSQAYAVAQEDQARMRAMRIPSLNNLNQTRTVTLDGRTFTVASTGKFINDVTGEEASCGEGTSSADYVRITSLVTWSGMGATPPQKIQSIVAPPSGSLDPNAGTLAVSVTNAAGGGISGIGLWGSGPATFSGSTDADGCAVFTNLPAGNYTLTPSGFASGLIDKDGDPPEPQAVGVVAGATNSVVLWYDNGGSIPVAFKYRIGSSSKFSPAYPSSQAARMDAVVAFNTNMTTAKVFGTPGGDPPNLANLISATPIFPFTSPVTVYAGSCEDNDPGVGSPGSASVTVPAGLATPVQEVQVPALDLNVWTGKNSWNKGSPYHGADVWIEDDYCDDDSGDDVLRRYETNSSGELDDPGLPWGRYDICVDNNEWGWGSRRDRDSNVVVKDYGDDTRVDLYLGSGSYSESESGSC